MKQKWFPASIVLSLLCASALPAAERKIVIKEWDVPTPSSRPHDPAEAPDGSLWYTGQRANKLGRLDPKTGAVTLKGASDTEVAPVRDRDQLEGRPLLYPIQQQQGRQYSPLHDGDHGICIAGRRPPAAALGHP